MVDAQALSSQAMVDAQALSSQAMVDAQACPAKRWCLKLSLVGGEQLGQIGASFAFWCPQAYSESGNPSMKSWDEETGRSAPLARLLRSLPRPMGCQSLVLASQPAVPCMLAQHW
ncbi:hypothetical protein NDU88_000574 [Pleurodeles waltl]|uniref:Uncharacterized protein n=1 Tax=Pleurodeles waltl TaxID=8319 RepID=A0AAV7V7V6_PLEWA|nr:hypothetical protein NDU88_000574 [Pleurodeles waltl]